MTAQVGIALKGVRKAYGTRCVLDIGELTFEPGHSYALIGANGSGKSTLLRALAGSSNLTGGSFEFFSAEAASGAIAPDGHSAAGEAEEREASVGYMPQKGYVFGFSVFKNVLLALDGLGLDKEEQAERVNRALKAVGMLEFSESRGFGLSGGEAQRVALARMLVRKHDVLLLDEPTASLDVAGTLQVEAALQAYVEETGCLLIVATHAPSQARRISDRAVMLDSGRVVEFGSTADVMDDPKSPEGRAFLSYWKI